MVAEINPLVSVIINVHNGEDFVGCAVQSVLNQTYKNFQLLIWENASTDSTLRAIEEFSADSRVTIISRPVKTSLFRARNEALKKVTGDLVAFLDADDYWMKNKLEVAVKAFSEDEIGVFYSNFKIHKEEKNLTRVAYGRNLPSGYVRRNLAANYTVCFSTIVFSSSALKSVDGPFNPEYSIIGDFELVLKLASRYRFGVHNRPLAVYRIHDKNLGESADELRKKDIAQWASENREEIKDNSNYSKHAFGSLIIDAHLTQPRGVRADAVSILPELGFAQSISLLLRKLYWFTTNWLWTKF